MESHRLLGNSHDFTVASKAMNMRNIIINSNVCIMILKSLLAAFTKCSWRAGGKTG